MSTTEHLSATLRLVEASRAAVARIPTLPGVETADALHRMGAAATELSTLLSSLPADLRFHALYPALVPQNPDHVSEFLKTRAPPALQQEHVEAEKTASFAGAGLVSSREYSAQVGRLRERYTAASRQAIERMEMASSIAREVIAAADFSRVDD